MIARQAPAPVLRVACISLVALLLAACAGNSQKPAGTDTGTQPASTAHTRQGHKPWKPLGPYTPGGLYAPGVADGTPDVPPDIANLPEPVPHAEPLSHYGNRSPYVVLGKTYTVLPSAAGYVERGVASWYGTKFDGRATSNFEQYDVYQFTAAHKTLPLPSYARVTNLDNGRSVIVRINDRGPFHDGRLIDLSYAAAVKLGVNVHGTAPVEVRGINPGQALPPAPAVAVSANHPAAATRTVAAPKANAAANQASVPKPPAPAASATMPSTTIAAPVAPAVVASQVSPKTSPVAQEPPVVKTQPAAPVPSAAEPAQSSAVTAEAPGTVPAASATASVVSPTTVTATATSSPIAPPTSASPPALQANVVTPAAILNGQPVPGHPPIEPSTQGFLQVASYSDRGNAEHMLQRLQQAGVEHAELVPVQVANQTMWRVHVGPLREDAAEQVAQHLDALGFGNPPFFKE